MKKKISGIILFFYLIGGFTSSYIFYKYSASINSENLQNRLNRFQLNFRSPGKWMDFLPGIFQEFPAASTILVLNQKTKLLGSLYEPSRISKNDYNEILKTYKTTELKRYIYTRTLTSSGISIWVISNPNLSPGEFLRSFFYSNSKMILIPATYFFILVILIILLFTEAPHKSRKGPENFPESTVPSENPYFPPANTEIPPSDRFLANKIMLLMDTIEKNFSTSKISFYSREAGKWIHVLEKSGNLVVRGDAAIENIPREIVSITDQNWREPLISADKKTLFIPLFYRNNLFGLLRMDFTGFSTDCSKDFIERLIGLCTNYSHTIFMQRIYDKAVSDPETDYYNYPYFYFMIKEKLAASRNFAIVVFELSDLNRISPEKTRYWALNLVVALTRVNLKPAVAARLERARFALLYNLQEGPSEVKVLNQLNNIPGIVKEVTQSSFHKAAKLTGGFFIRPTGYEDADAFMKRLDYLIINSVFSAYASDFENTLNPKASV